MIKTLFGKNMFVSANRIDKYPQGVYNIAASEVKSMSDEEKTCCCHCRTKHRDDKEERDLLNRLSRIEGQIRGIRGMVEKDAYCPDILTQVAAASAALNSFSKVLLANHIKTCVAQDELLTTLQKLMR